MSAALNMIAAHLVGDFVTQTDALARSKRTFLIDRAWHVTLYSFPFAFVFLFSDAGYRLAARLNAGHLVLVDIAFWVAVAVPHFVVDSFNWSRPTLLWLGFLMSLQRGGECKPGCDLCASMRAEAEELAAAPDPWPPKPILVDQSIHAACLAIAAAVFGL